MFGRNFVITCDSCHKWKLDTGEKDVVSCNALAVEAGWEHTKSVDGRKTIHICQDCLAKDKIKP